MRTRFRCQGITIYLVCEDIPTIEARVSVAALCNIEIREEGEGSQDINFRRKDSENALFFSSTLKMLFLGITYVKGSRKKQMPSFPPALPNDDVIGFLSTT